MRESSGGEGSLEGSLDVERGVDRGSVVGDDGRSGDDGLGDRNVVRGRGSGGGESNLAAVDESRRGEGGVDDGAELSDWRAKYQLP